MGSCLSIGGRSAAHGNGYVPAPLPPSSSVGKRKSFSRKRPSSSSFPLSEMEMSLHRIPERIFLNGSTEVASLFSKQGKKGINQDAMIVWQNFCSRKDTIFCGVFDGHGPNGHMVAKKVRDCLPLKLNAQMELNSLGEDGFNNSSSAMDHRKFEETSFTSVYEKTKTYLESVHKENQTDILLRLKDSFLKAFKVMDKELKFHPNAECLCSGTTAVTALKKGQDLVIGNVGDSRAVLGTRDQDGCLIPVQLTVDLKPNLPRESERIMLCKGRVFALPSEPNVARIWLPNSDSPGLAMSRAFGDFCLKDYGLISIPDVSYRRITEKDEFVILATDGVWDVLSNEEVVDIVASAPRSIAARAVVESAVRMWRFKHPTAKVDDCAVVCLFLGSRSDESSTSCSMSKELAIESSAQVSGGKKEDDTVHGSFKKLRENNGG
ncbi:probable protein phosphatase 2C 33 isoform X2 [Tripterygium wilfordii]|nr:probable protein phosphatase 2C 33 isoform X2 [Tripterygium wilfordii]